MLTRFFCRQDFAPCGFFVMSIFPSNLVMVGFYHVCFFLKKSRLFLTFLLLLLLPLFFMIVRLVTKLWDFLTKTAIPHKMQINLKESKKILV